MITLLTRYTQAANLGLPEASASTGYRPYRGRGRPFRGSFCGAPPNRASMKLDNRPKKLIIKGASSEHQQALHDWFEVGFFSSVPRISDNRFS